MSDVRAHAANSAEASAQVSNPQLLNDGRCRP